MKRALGLFLLAVVGTVNADQLVCPVTDVATVASRPGRSQIVFDCDLSALGADAVVRQAVLRFDLAGGTEDRILSLRVYPLAQDRERGSVAFDEGVAARAAVDLRAPGQVDVDLTPLVKELVEWARPAHGFVATVDPAQGDGLTAADAARLAGISNGRVEVHWRRTTPRGARG